MGNVSIIDFIIVISYLLGIMMIGIWAGYRKNTSSKDFFMAGNSLRWPMIGAALFTANISTIHLVGLAASGYDIGLVIGNFEWMAAFCLIALGLIFVPLYLKSKIHTLPAFLEVRYGKEARLIMAFIAIVSALLVHIGISLYAGAKLFEYFFGISPWISVIIISSITATYTILGGLKAIVVTDTIQAVILLIGAILLTLLAAFALPEIAGIHSFAEFKDSLKPNQFNMLHNITDESTGKLNQYSWLNILLGYPILGIWYWCTDQTIVQKSLGAKSVEDAKKGAIFAGLLKILPLFLMVLPGVLAYALFSEKIGDDANSTLLVLMEEILPVGLLGLFLASLLAALMSTIESALNSVATITAEDIVKHFRPEISDRSLVKIGRITAGIVIVLAMLWSTQGGKFDSIFEAINKIPMMFGPSITCVILFGVFWPRGNRQACLNTFIVGLITGVIYFIIDVPLIGETKYVSDTLGIPFMMSGFLIFCLCCIVYVVSALLTSPPPESVKEVCWAHPLEPLKGEIKGIFDSRLTAAYLFITMLILYCFLG